MRWRPLFPVPHSSVALLAAFVLGLASQEPTQATIVPVEVGNALRKSPDQFARTAAAAGFAVGIVATATWSATETSRIAIKNIEGRTTLADVFELFRALHPDYQASISDGVLKFRPLSSSVCDPALAATVPPVSASGTDVEVVSRLIELSRPFDKAVRGGTVGSTLGKPGEAPRAVPERRTSVNLGGGFTLESALDQLARNLRGTAWMATEGTDSTKGRPNCFVSLFRSDGTAAIFGVDLANR